MPISAINVCPGDGNNHHVYHKRGKVLSNDELSKWHSVVIVRKQHHFLYRRLGGGGK